MVPVMPQSTTPFSSAGTTSPKAIVTADAPKRLDEVGLRDALHADLLALQVGDAVDVAAAVEVLLGPR